MSGTTTQLTQEAKNEVPTTRSRRKPTLSPAPARFDQSQCRHSPTQFNRSRCSDFEHCSPHSPRLTPSPLPNARRRTRMPWSMTVTPHILRRIHGWFREAGMVPMTEPRRCAPA